MQSNALDKSKKTVATIYFDQVVLSILQVLLYAHVVSRIFFDELMQKLLKMVRMLCKSVKDKSENFEKPFNTLTGL